MPPASAKRPVTPLQRAARVLAPVLAAVASSFLLYRAWPVLLLAVGAACLGWLLWQLTHALLPQVQPPWLPQAIAGAMWLLYAMQLAYGWRLEMGYWVSLWTVFGWYFINALFWAAVLAWAARAILKSR